MVLKSYASPFSVKSNFARENAGLVAAAASMGYITTEHIDGQFGQSWYVTVDGLKWLHGEGDE